jgi:magnesium transporter
MTQPKVLLRNKIGTKVGKKPGFLFIPDNALKPRLFLMSFSSEFFEEQEFDNYQDLRTTFFARPDAHHWIDIRGYGDLTLLEEVMQDFKIHSLQMEDVINDYQRPKLEEEDGRLFIVARMLAFTPLKHFDDDQLSIFIGENYVLTFQSDYEDCLEPLRDRIRAGKGIVRTSHLMYLTYAMLDVVVDHYFPVMAQMADYLEELEASLFDNPSRNILTNILSLKKEIVRFRRIAWPVRDKMNEILHLDEDYLPENLRKFYKDIYDHTIQVIDLLDNYKEMTGSLTEIYLSNVSNRMNEIMKVLTIISTIFIPLSFIVGLYGMNFARQNPDTGKTMPLSMPELYQPYGYVILVCAMVILIILQLIFFYRKGWLSKF